MYARGTAYPFPPEYPEVSLVYGIQGRPMGGATDTNTPLSSLSIFDQNVNPFGSLKIVSFLFRL